MRFVLLIIVLQFSLICIFTKQIRPLQHKCVNRPLGCPKIYSPVCGWFDKTVQCLRYPCAINADNYCLACKNKHVIYYTKGKCPR